MIIEGHKAIAAALSKFTGREVTGEMVRHWARRARDPLPLSYFAGHPGIDTTDLADWTARQKGARRGGASGRADARRESPPQLPLLPFALA